MKTLRFVAVVLTVALFATAFAPVPTQQSVAANNNTVALNTPAESFVDTAFGLPLFSSLMFAASAPAITVTYEALSSTSGYSCKLVSQTPADWTRMGRRQYFDTKWTVKNTGTKTWSTSGIDLKFTGGVKMHTYGNSFDLRANTSPGKTVILIVDMNAPKTYGYYTAYWGLYTGNSMFCRLSITINVNH